MGLLEQRIRHSEIRYRFADRNFRLAMFAQRLCRDSEQSRDVLLRDAVSHHRFYEPALLVGRLPWGAAIGPFVYHSSATDRRRPLTGRSSRPSPRQPDHFSKLRPMSSHIRDFAGKSSLAVGRSGENIVAACLWRRGA
jgi:hypothetical protein